MRALVLRAGRATLETGVARPAPRSGSTRVAVRCAGVCATDLALAEGYMGFEGVPGHEFTGLALDGPLQGRRVVGEINAGCGRCPRCAAGDPRHCRARSVLGIQDHQGAFAEELSLPTENLVPLPEHLEDDAAVFAEPLAAALAVADEQPEALAAAIGHAGEPGSEAGALVVGDGRLGLLIAACLALRGAAVDLAGRHPERARMLPAGVRHLGRALEPEGAPGADRRYPLVVEASGRPEVLAAALRRVAPCGMLVLKTTAARPTTLDLAPLVVDEIRLQGSRCGRFAPAVELLASGVFDPRPMIEERYPLSRATEALARARSGGVLKVLIDIT